MSRGLQRFLDAQDSSDAGYAAALAEIRDGRKRSHWIWYVFPQLAGLGRSPMAHAYAIDGLGEAIEYLRHPTLRARLLEITNAVNRQLAAGAMLPRLMGSDVDALKLVSSLTLFGAAAESIDDAAVAAAAGEGLRHAERQGYRTCEFTRAQLGRSL